MISIHYRVTIVQYIVANNSSRTLFNTIDIPLIKNTSYNVSQITISIIRHILIIDNDNIIIFLREIYELTRLL